MSAPTPYRSVNIRKKDRNKILESLLPGHVTQVCGPPMVGKCTLVDQALEDSKSPFICHKFNCGNQYSFCGVLNVIAQNLGLQPLTVTQLTEEMIVSMLISKLVQCSAFHHVLVFKKCEGLRCEILRTYGQDHLFIDFVWRIIGCISGSLKVSVVFTSCKKFHLVGEKARTIEIGALSFWDVLSILQCYAPDVDVLPYVKVCLNTLPLPGAVRRFAEEFLVDDDYRQSPEVLEEYIEKDESFLSMVFGSKLDNVDKWVPQDILPFVVNFSSYFGRSFTIQFLESVVGRQGGAKMSRLMTRLLQNYVIWTAPDSDRLVVHPLFVYYSVEYRRRNCMVVGRDLYDHSNNRYTDFLCRILRTTEMNMKKLGNKVLVYGSLAQEWPHIRSTIEMALSCNQNTYQAFLKAVVSARGIILKCFAKEAHGIYKALYDCAKEYGTRSERAVIKALLGHSKASTEAFAKGGTWQQVEDCLDSAIRKLITNGPAFMLFWAINRKTFILTRQGKYKEAEVYLKASKRVTLPEIYDHDLDRTFGISKLQVKEEKITSDIYEANILIFLGKHEQAHEVLFNCFQDMQNEYADHPEKAIALNSVGLSEERGNKDLMKAVKWYKQSYAERQIFARFNKEIMVIPLNNIGMIFLQLGQFDECKKYLEEALNIRNELGRVHTHTSLTLIHLGALNIARGDLAKAFMDTLEAEAILQKVAKDHETRLRLNNKLGHLRQLMITKAKRDPQFKHGERNSDKFPEEYFELALQIADRIIGNLSGDGYHHFLLVHEHLMLHALRNSREKFNKHKYKILPYFLASQGIGRRICTESEKIIAKHMDLYTYFSTTGYDDIDKTTYVNHLAKVCEFCRLHSNLCTAEEMWCEDVQHSAISTKEREAAKAQPGLYFSPVQYQRSTSHQCESSSSSILTLPLKSSKAIKDQQKQLNKMEEHSSKLTSPGILVSNSHITPVSEETYQKLLIKDDPTVSKSLNCTDAVKSFNTLHNASPNKEMENSKSKTCDDTSQHQHQIWDKTKRPFCGTAGSSGQLSVPTYSNHERSTLSNNKHHTSTKLSSKHNIDGTGIRRSNLNCSNGTVDAQYPNTLQLYGQHNDVRNDVHNDVHNDHCSNTSGWADVQAVVHELASDMFSTSCSLCQGGEHRNENIVMLPLNIPLSPTDCRYHLDQTYQHAVSAPTLFETSQGHLSLDSLSDNELQKCGSNCDHL